MKFCTKCGIEKPLLKFSKSKKSKDGHRSDCKECVKAYCDANQEKIAVAKKMYYEANKDRILTRNKNYRKINKDRVLAQKKDYYENHKHTILAQCKTYRDANREKKAYRDKLYHEANRPKILAKKKVYREAHKPEIKSYGNIHRDETAAQRKVYRKTFAGKAAYLKSNQKRRALKKGASVENFNPSEVLERDGYICQHCHRKTRPDFKNKFHALYPNVDHIVPLSQGGDHSKLNTQCLCRRCNMEKGSFGTGDQLKMFG